MELENLMQDQNYNLIDIRETGQVTVMWICHWNTNAKEHSLFRNNSREKGEGNYATYLTQMIRMQQKTRIESLNDNTKEKNIVSVGGSDADPGTSSG